MADFAMVPFDNSNEVKTKMKEFKWLKKKKSLVSEIKKYQFQKSTFFIVSVCKSQSYFEQLTDQKVLIRPFK